jgi:predicted RNA binding protein YcfA (HicA-like mRNA interferase family)
MGKFEKLVLKILQGFSDKNIDFKDLQKVLLKLGFYERIKGSHYIYTKENVEEIINIQPSNEGNAKPYQVKQVREIIIKYQLLENYE